MLQGGASSYRPIAPGQHFDTTYIPVNIPVLPSIEKYYLQYFGNVTTSACTALYCTNKCTYLCFIPNIFILLLPPIFIFRIDLYFFLFNLYTSEFCFMKVLFLCHRQVEKSISLHAVLCVCMTNKILI